MNVRAYKYWVVMALIVSLGIALRQELFGENHRLHEPAAQSAGVPFSSSAERVVSEAPIRSTKSPSAAINMRKSKSPMSPGSNVNHVSTTPLQVTITDVDKSVVGSAFPISASVLSACRNHGCDEVREKLTEMANEPRDNVWATQMEIEIQNNITSQGRDRYTIRDIECRSSICGIETASLEGQYLGPSYNDPLRTNLTGGELIPIWGYETDASGARITVSVIVLMRR